MSEAKFTTGFATGLTLWGLVVGAFATGGCRGEGGKISSPPLPPLPSAEVHTAEMVRVERGSSPGPDGRLGGSLALPGPTKNGQSGGQSGKKVTLAWENRAEKRPTNYFTVIVASTDLVHWAEVWRGAYETQALVTLSNRPAAEFYRAGNGVVQW